MIDPSIIIPHQLLVKQVNMLSWLILGSKVLMKYGLTIKTIMKNSAL
jgi:hypothetical protein